MKTATLEVLEPGEKVLGSKTAGSYFVREFVDGEHMGGSFFSKLNKKQKIILKNLLTLKYGIIMKINKFHRTYKKSTSQTIS